MVIVAVDKLAVEDFQEFPGALTALTTKLSQGAAGLMNVRTAGSAASASGYLSLATGSRAAAGQWAGLALTPGETHQGFPAPAYYQSLTGSAAAGAFLHLGIGELYQKNATGSTGTGSLPLLGSFLKKAGLTAALLGDADAAGERRRYGALLVMDEAGTVSLGGAGSSLLKEDAAFPGGVRTDYERLQERLGELLDVADVIAVDLGDLARLETVSGFLTSERARELRRTALERIAIFVSQLVEKETARPRIVYVVSPSPSAMLGRPGILITPVLRWEIEPQAGAAGASGTGLLTSATTRRPGLIANVDFLPTVLDELGLGTPTGAGGRPWQVLPHAGAFDALLARYDEIKRVHLQRLPVIQPYFFGVLTLVVAGTTGILLAQFGFFQPSLRTALAWRILLTAFLSVPAALLLLALFPHASLATTWIGLGVLSLLLTLLAALAGRRRALGPPGVLGVITVVLLCADIVLEAPLMQRSLLGYDPVAGSRFYGIGNEYMGALIGAGLMACAWILGDVRDEGTRSKRRAIIPTLLFVALTFLMLHPRLGINVGGAISAASTAVFAYAFASGRRLNARLVLGSGAAIAAVLVVTAYFDSLLFGQEASHLGQVMKSTQDLGADPLWSMFGRKLAVNWRLIRLTVWSRVVFVALALLAVTAFVPNRLGGELERRFPGLIEMTKAAVAASLVALVVNDSGVVAASTLLLWPVLTVLSVAPCAARPGGRAS